MTDFNTWFPTSKYGRDALNVKSFGALGNNSHNDGPAIQACFDAAFGPANAPHGNGGQNAPVYFPAGRYLTQQPLQLTAVWGGRIFGDGIFQSNISYTGPLTPVGGEGWIPTLWLNGFNFGEISNLTFAGPADNSGHKTVCMWFGPDGANGGSSAHGNLIANCSSGGQAAYGIIQGSAASAANSENTFLNCVLPGIHEVGFLLSGANTLNVRWIGGGVDSCKTGIKTNNSAMIPIIENVAFANNLLDIDLAASGHCVISGIRSESNQLLRANAPVTMLNCHSSLPGDRVTGSISGTTLTVTALGTRGTVCFPGSLVFGPGLPNSYNSQASGKGITQIVQQLSGAGVGGVGTYELSQSASVPSGTLAIAGVFAEVVGSGIVTMDMCGSDNDQCILGDNNSVISITGNNWFSANDGAIAPHLLAAYNGFVLNYDIASRGEFIVANLPPAAPHFRGVRMFVTDAVADTFGVTVAGGSNKSVPIWCDGSAWRIG